MRLRESLGDEMIITRWIVKVLGLRRTKRNENRYISFGGRFDLGPRHLGKVQLLHFDELMSIFGSRR